MSANFETIIGGIGDIADGADELRYLRRVCSAAEAAELLEALRRAYRKLTPYEQREAKASIASLWDCQSRFGSAAFGN